MRKIDKYLNSDKYIKKIALEIVKSFKEKSSKDNLDYSFDIDRKTMKIMKEEANTFFCFDTEAKTELNRFKKALFDKDLEQITTPEEIDLNNDIIHMFKEVSKYINENHIDEIREVIRKIVFPKTPKEQIPLKTVKIFCIDIMDYSSVPDFSKYLLEIGKKKEDKEVLYVDTEGVIKFISNKIEDLEKGETDLEKILKEEKEKENPLFENIVALKRGKKYLFEVNISLFVDYSFS
jgi:hypothetical protein